MAVPVTFAIVMSTAGLQAFGFDGTEPDIVGPHCSGGSRGGLGSAKKAVAAEHPRCIATVTPNFFWAAYFGCDCCMWWLIPLALPTLVGGVPMVMAVFASSSCFFVILGLWLYAGVFWYLLLTFG
jgi:hypothetical protein